MFEVLFYCSVGLAAGFLSGLLGVGGGMLVVPVLLATFYFLDFPQETIMQTAIGTSLAAMVVTSGASAWAHLKGVIWFLFKALTPGIILGAILGALVAHMLSTKYLQLIFGLFICLFGTYFLLTAKFNEVEGKIKPSLMILRLIGLIIGVISSILGIGGGIITVPLSTFLEPH